MVKKGSQSTKRKKASQSTKIQKYQSIYLLLGLFVAFLSFIALFNWGFVGLMLANGFRLMVGEAYSLILFVFLLSGITMMIKGNIVRVNPRRLIGGLLVLIAITGVLHFVEFHHYLKDYPNLSVFDYTFELYRNELLTQQNKYSLGGGMLGAGLYASMGYLFGKWGAYIFFFAIFLIGLVCLMDVPLTAGWQALKEAFLNSWKLIRRLFPDFSEMRSIFNEEKETVSTNGGRQEVDFNKEGEGVLESEQKISKQEAETLEEISPQEQKKQDQSRNPIQNIWQSFQNFFLSTNAEKVEESAMSTLSSNQYMPTIEREEAPVYKPDKEYVFEAYRHSDPKANTAEMRRQTRPENGKVLDLDFFDQMNPVPDEMKIEQPESIDRSADVIQVDTDEIEKDGSLEDLVQSMPEEANLENKSLSKSVSEAPTASHWQESSSERQALTDDGMDNVLSKGEQIEAVKAKRKEIQEYQLPGKDLLKKLPAVDQSEEYKRINQNIEKLEITFESFGVDAKVVKANLGPSVTKYEIQPAVGVKVSKIVNLADDIALSLAARDVRIEAPIPGKSLIGIEVPNTQVSPVAFSEIIDAGLESNNLLEVPLGRDVAGSVCLADLSKMPHLLIAGSTGSGKSVGINVIICSLLMKAKPEEVKFLMVDPKKVELTLYNELPHLLSPVVTNPRKAARALNNVVEEMERRYELFATTGVRNIDGYNEQVEQWNQKEGTGYERLPKIVVFIDELADLMMVASNDVENAIIRLAQMARAAGIHMIIATQRPSVDVITGIIKANVPSRLAFAVSSGTDSRTILDAVGAEKLLGRGDMLFQPMGKSKPIRVQGAYISDDEVERITDFIKDQRSVNYDEKILVSDDDSQDVTNASDDEYYQEAVELISGQETVSISQLQRKFRIGYNRAARLIDDLEAQGLISSQDGSKPRQVLMDQIMED
ncbi:DNA translocase FtsK [Facklamia lactis]|nr:DNA translocase FtsK [Facklamia lactis]